MFGIRARCLGEEAGDGEGRGREVMGIIVREEVVIMDRVFRMTQEMEATGIIVRGGAMSRVVRIARGM
jgi:hypothetical protein